MYRPIDPKVDCVFKILLESDDHRDLLIHVLNAILNDELPAPVLYTWADLYSQRLRSGQD